MKIAVLGGTFNPVHIGHLMLAEDVRLEFGYDKIIFIPACIPPHKTYSAVVSDEDRLEMLRLAVKSNPHFVVDDCELKRKGLSFTLDTILELEERYKDVLEDKIGLIIGDDLLAGFGAWYKAKVLAEHVQLIVGKRLSSELPSECEFSFLPLKNPILNVSSSKFRSRMQENLSCRYMVCDSVYDYICKKALYGKAEGKWLEELTENVKNFAEENVKKSRFEHIIRVARTCEKLAEKYGENPALCYFAGIAHDICKDFSDEELLHLASLDGGSISELELRKPALLHGRAAAIVLLRDFSFDDADVLQAVRFHTFGQSGMCNVAKILYIADKIEPGRPYVNAEYMARLEKLSLDELALLVLNENIDYLEKKGCEIAAETYDLRRSLLEGING